MNASSSRSDGFFLVHRGWRDNPVFTGDFSRADAWIWLIENACWKPARAKIKGAYVDLQRGELTFSMRFMAEKWGWSKSRVERFIADLRQESMIETRSKIGTTSDHNAGQGQIIISICNYAKYQDIGEAKRDKVDPVRGTTAGQQRDKEEQGNKGTIEEEEAKASPSKRAKPKHRMPDEWEPMALTGDTAHDVSQWPQGAISRELERFRDWAAAGGPNTLKSNWDAAWRNWLRRIHDEGRYRNGRQEQNNRYSQPSSLDAYQRALELTGGAEGCDAAGSREGHARIDQVSDALRAIGYEQ